MRKTRRKRLYTYPWNPQVCKLSINFIRVGDRIAFPLYWKGRGKLFRRKQFLLVTQRGDSIEVSLRTFELDGAPCFFDLPLNRPDTAEYLAEAVASGSRLELGLLQLVRTNWDDRVYVITKKVPADSKVKLPVPASKLVATPA